MHLDIRPVISKLTTKNEMFWVEISVGIVTVSVTSTSSRISKLRGCVFCQLAYKAKSTYRIISGYNRQISRQLLICLD
jgi:hypothetical protein